MHAEIVGAIISGTNNNNRRKARSVGYGTRRLEDMLPSFPARRRERMIDLLSKGVDLLEAVRQTNDS